jgi:hypothetical protein
VAAQQCKRVEVVDEWRGRSLSSQGLGRRIFGGRCETPKKATPGNGHDTGRTLDGIAADKSLSDHPAKAPISNPFSLSIASVPIPPTDLASNAVCVFQLALQSLCTPRLSARIRRHPSRRNPLRLIQILQACRCNRNVGDYSNVISRSASHRGSHPDPQLRARRTTKWSVAIATHFGFSCTRATAASRSRHGPDKRLLQIPAASPTHRLQSCLSRCPYARSSAAFLVLQPVAAFAVRFPHAASPQRRRCCSSRILARSISCAGTTPYPQSRVHLRDVAAAGPRAVRTFSRRPRRSAAGKAVG